MRGRVARRGRITVSGSRRIASGRVQAGRRRVTLGDGLVPAVRLRRIAISGSRGGSGDHLPPLPFINLLPIAHHVEVALSTQVQAVVGAEGHLKPNRVVSGMVSRSGRDEGEEKVPENRSTPPRSAPRFQVESDSLRSGLCPVSNKNDHQPR